MIYTVFLSCCLCVCVSVWLCVCVCLCVCVSVCLPVCLRCVDFELYCSVNGCRLKAACST